MNQVRDLARSAPVAPSIPPSTYTGSSFGEADRHALRKLKLFAILYLVIIVAGFIIGLGGNLFALQGMFQANTVAPSLTSALFTSLLTFVGVGTLVTATVEVLALLQLRSAFHSLSQTDARRFSSPAKFTTVAIIGLPILYGGILLVLGGLSSVVSNLGAGYVTSAQIFAAAGFGYLAAGGVLSFIAAVVLLIGVIGGPIIGLWRVGERYDADTIKAAAVVYIIPLVQIAAPILVLVGLSNVSMNLEATGKARG